MRKLFILSLISIIIATGCSVNYHVRKAIKKGYIAEGVRLDTIRINTVDSFPVIIRDSIVWEKFVTSKDTLIEVRTNYVTKTRFVERINLKRFNDSLKHFRTLYSDSLRNALKTSKNTLKTDLKQQRVEKGKTFTDTMKFIAISLFFILLIGILFKLNQYFKID